MSFNIKSFDPDNSRQWVLALVNKLPVRQRYLLTRDNKLRLRVIVPALAFVFVMMAGFGMALVNASDSWIQRGEDGSNAGIYQTASLDRQATGPEAERAAMQKRLQRYTPEDITEAAPVVASVPRPKPLHPRERNLKIGKGDTLAGVLQKAGVGAGDAYSAVEAMKKYYDPRSIRPGQQVHVRFDPSSAGTYDFAALRVDIDALKSVTLERTADQAFKAGVEEKDVETRVYAKKAPIEVSLYGSAEKAGVPSSVIAQAIHIYSWDVDFQRDIRRGDSLEVMYEQKETAEGIRVKSGDILYARLDVNGQEIPVYRYELPDGTVDYFTADGVSVRKALMRTPVDGARISSGFGMRKHPVLGYSKMHKGIDFAVARGTPIYAAGDGTIERIGPWSSYGNYVRIRHNATIKTAYGHMNGFAKGLHAGSRVKQGQVIGYVGMTGRATGPHLHYEVLVSGKQVNPKTVKLPQGETLTGKQLVAFKAHIHKLDRQYASLSSSTQLASLR